MRTIACPRYGPPSVLEIRDAPMPAISETEILIRTRAVSVTTGDCRVRALRMPSGFGLIGRLALGFAGPRQPVLGSELSGVVVATGKDVTKYKVGDEVILYTGTKLGCYAEYKAVSQDAGLVRKPPHMPFPEAAALAPSGSTALSFLRRGGVGQGSRVLIVGASGGVGSAAVMLAKHLGAHVTAVCNGPKADFVVSLGADRVIDYTREDFQRSGETYDAILDASGTVSYRQAKGSLKPNGSLLLVSASLPQILSSAFAAKARGHKVIAGPAPWTVEDLNFLAKAAEAGALHVALDRTFPFEQIAEAHAYVDEGRKTGNVAVSC